LGIDVPQASKNIDTGPFGRSPNAAPHPALPFQSA
jgi:hypothetical protein